MFIQFKAGTSRKSPTTVDDLPVLVKPATGRQSDICTAVIRRCGDQIRAIDSPTRPFRGDPESSGSSGRPPRRCLGPGGAPAWSGGFVSEWNQTRAVNVGGGWVKSGRPCPLEPPRHRHTHTDGRNYTSLPKMDGSLALESWRSGETEEREHATREDTVCTLQLEYRTCGETLQGSFCSPLMTDFARRFRSSAAMRSHADGGFYLKPSPRPTFLTLHLLSVCAIIPGAISHTNPFVREDMASLVSRSPSRPCHKICASKLPRPVCFAATLQHRHQNTPALILHVVSHAV